MTTQSLDLNLIPKGISPRLYVSQYDKGQTWTFNIYAGNTAYTIPNGATVTIQGTKPDKTGFQYSCTASGNVVTATEQQQMTVIAGEVPAEIRITNNNEIIATLNFILVVEPAALTDETEISETDLPIIEQAIEMFPHYQEMIDEVSSDIQTLSNVRAELGAHNLFDLKTQAPTVETLGITFVTNANNKTVTANGLCTASSGSTSRINTPDTILKAGSYIFSAGLPATGSDTTYYCFLYDRTNSRRAAVVYADEDVAFTVNSDIVYTVYFVIVGGYTANNIVYKPMIRDARDTDKTFAPFSKPNTELTKDTKGLTDNQFENGCVNMLENKANSQTITTDGANLTVIANDDKTITINGGSGTTNKYIPVNTTLKLKKGRYHLSGAPSVSTASLHALYIAVGGNYYWDYVGNGVDFEVTASESESALGVYIVCMANNTLTNAIFKPMITYADVPNSDYAHYVPYAMTNQQITNAISNIKMKTFSYRYEQPTVAETVYTIDNAKTVVFGLTSSDIVVGIAWKTVAGNTSTCMIKPGYNNAGKLMFRPDYGNTEFLMFTGVVFYI